MLIDFDFFQERAQHLRQRIITACQLAGRDPASVRLLPVTKNHPVAAADYAWRSGFAAVGENRVQEAIVKRAQLSSPLHWELIGHLQSNKAKAAATHFDRIQSVDSEKLLTALDRAAGELGKKLAVLLQINAGHDPAKFGIEPASAPHLLEAALAKPHLRVDGLMTIAPLSTDPTVPTRTFVTLRTLRDQLANQFGHALPELSMGMSNDLEAAIAAGSSLLRVGTALYGPR